MYMCQDIVRNFSIGKVRQRYVGYAPDADELCTMKVNALLVYLTSGETLQL